MNDLSTIHYNIMTRPFYALLSLLLLAAAARADEAVVTATVRYSLTLDGAEQTSYTQTATGAAPLRVGFDAPRTFFGATTAATRADSVTVLQDTTINIAYDYALDTSCLPFEPAQLMNGSFTSGTKWYYLRPTRQTTYAYLDGTTLPLAKNVLTDPADTKYFFTFTGNPLTGYQIRTYDGGPTLGVTAGGNTSEPDEASMTTMPSTFMLEAGTASGQYRLRYAAYDDRGQSYLNAYASPLGLYSYTWSSGYAGYTGTDENSQFYIHAVSPALMDFACEGQMAIDATIPALGAVNELGDIHVLFDQPIHHVYGHDGEDTPKAITLTNAQGETVRTFAYDDDAYGYAIDAENAYQLNLTQEEPLTAYDKYVLTIPEGLVYAADGTTNAEQKLQYTVKEIFEAQTVVGRVYSSSIGAHSGTAWPLLPYDETLGYYTIKVRMDAADELTLLDYTGQEGESLSLSFDQATGKLLTVGGEEPDSEGDFWVESSVLDGTYSGYYLVNQAGSITFDRTTGHGTAGLKGMDYDTWTPYTMFVEWYTDNRFANDPKIIRLLASDPAQGRVDSLSHITLTFDRALTELRTATPTLLDAYGNAAGGTLTAMLSTEHPEQILIALSETVTRGGYYTLTLPQTLAAREDDNPGVTEKTSITWQVGTPEADTLTWSHAAIDYHVDGWDDPLFDDAGLMKTLTAEYYAVSHRLVLRNYLGVEGKSLTVAFDGEGNIKSLNGTTATDGFIGIYTDYPDYYWADFYIADASYSLDEANGYIILPAYFYADSDDEGSYRYYAITWDPETVTGIGEIHNSKFTIHNCYNLKGQRVTGKLQRGVYIVDGKKVVVR